MTRRRQCPACGAGWQPYVLQDRLPTEPLRLQSRPKADYRDELQAIFDGLNGEPMPEAVAA